MVGLPIYVHWKLGYFGSIIPNTFFAKGANEPHLAAGLAYLGAFLRSYPQVLLLILCIAIATWFLNPGRRYFFCWYVLISTVAYTTYLVRVGGDFMEYRLMLHLYPLLITGSVVGCLWCAARARGVVVFWVTLAVFCSAFPTRLEMKYYMQSLDEMNQFVGVGMKVAKRLADLPENTRIATTLIGTVGYYSGLYIIDQWGLVDSSASRLPQSVGHSSAAMSNAHLSNASRGRGRTS